MNEIIAQSTTKIIDSDFDFNFRYADIVNYIISSTMILFHQIYVFNLVKIDVAHDVSFNLLMKY